MRKFHAALVILILLSMLSCKLVDQALSPAAPTATGAPTLAVLPTSAVAPSAVPSQHPAATSTTQTNPLRPFISQIIFCEDVSEDGEPVGPTTSFAAGTTEVWAFFTYSGMQEGTSWSRLWELDGEVYLNAEGEIWEDGAEGWLAYSIYDSDDAPLSGNYSLTISLEGQPIQQGSFTVAKASNSNVPGFPAFGPIQFAHDVAEEVVPVQPSSEFEDGINEVFAVFPYINMTGEQNWKRVWLQDGEVVAESEPMVWEESTDGITYSSLTSEEGLNAGQYTLNLYIDDQLVRSANFSIVGAIPTALPPATPDELIDADLRPAWDILYNAVDDYNFLNDLAQFVLDHRIRIKMDESYSGSTMAVYRYDGEQCQPDYGPGEVIVYRQTWNESSWEELAGTLAHELTHAMQHYDGGYRCPGCSVYKEFHAFIAEYYTFMMIGRTELIPESLYGADGYFDSDLLWDTIKELYGDDCPDY